MDEVAGADSTIQSDIVTRSASGDGALSARDAANSLLDARRKDNAGTQRRDDEQDQSEAREAATAAETPAQAEDTAPERDPGGTQEADPAPQEPPIEPPRSWTKEDKELFKGLPRETQQRLADRERSREGDFLRRQNEAAEKLKGLSTREQAVEQARTHYESALPSLLQALQETQAGEFADIQSIADIEKMARENWPRYVLWDAQQKKIAAVAQHVQAAQQRQEQEKAQKRQTFMSDEDAKFAEKAPELATPEAKLKAAQGAADMLKDLGFSASELNDMWNGTKEISLRDHRIQLLIRDGVRYREAQAKAKTPAPKPVPQVQRPGPAAPRNADADDKVKDLDTRLTNSGNLRDAAALLVAQRQARARR